MTQRTRAFTIIEALVAIVVLLCVLLAMIGLVPRTFANAQRDSTRTEALSSAQQYLDTLHEYVANNKFTASSLPSPAPVTIDAGDTFEGSAAIASPGTFQLANNGCPQVGGSAKMFDCVVTVTWTESGASRKVSVESFVTQQI
ncbi:MAG TPA: hypothetical protein VFF60_01035 [Candidatus Binatus sp.]|nr:hypothetical protein [Candidatus Binatus sp.]